MKYNLEEGQTNKRLLLRACMFVAISITLATVEAYQYQIHEEARNWFWRLYIPASLFSLYILATSVSSAGIRLLIVILGITVLYQITTIDRRLGELEFQKLCLKENELKVRKKVHLSKEWFDDSGSLRFLEMFDSRPVMKELGFSTKIRRLDYSFGLWGKYYVMSAQILSNSTGESIAESRYLIWEKGGVPSLHPRLIKCDAVASPGISELIGAAFVPAQ